MFREPFIEAAITQLFDVIDTVVEDVGAEYAGGREIRIFQGILDDPKEIGGLEDAGCRKNGKPNLIR